MTRFLLFACALLATAVNCDARLVDIKRATVIEAEADGNEGGKSLRKISRSSARTVITAAVKTEANKKIVTGSSESVLDKLRGPLCVLGGALAHLTFGSVYCWGNFQSYAPSNLRFFDGKDHPGVQPDSSLVMPVYFLGQCLSMPFGPLIVKKLGARATLLLGAWIMAAGVYLASFANNLAAFLLPYSFLFGAGVGVGYTAPMLAGWSWMPNAKGLVSGAILTGFGAGGFIFNMIGTKIANPKSLDPVNGKFPAEVYSNFPVMLRKLAIIYAALSAVGSMLVTEKKAAPVPTTSKNKSKNAAVAEVPGVEVSAALKTPQFWLVWMMIITAASAGLNVASLYKQFAATNPALKGDSYQSLVGGMAAIFNGLGRLFWGSFSDKVGFKNAFTALTIMQAANQLFYKYSATAKNLFLVANCVSYFLLGGVFSMMPPAIQRVFGPKNGALIYGLAYSAFGVASIGTTYLSKSLVSSFGWDGVFKVLASVTLLATLLTSALKPLASLPSSAV